MISSMCRDRGSFNTSSVSMSTSTVDTCITVQNFLPETTSWNSSPVIISRDWSKITNNKDQFVRASSFPYKTYNTLFQIVEIHPLETLDSKIQFMEGRFHSI